MNKQEKLVKRLIKYTEIRKELSSKIEEARKNGDHELIIRFVPVEILRRLETTNNIKWSVVRKYLFIKKVILHL